MLMLLRICIHLIYEEKVAIFSRSCLHQLKGNYFIFKILKIDAVEGLLMRINKERRSNFQHRQNAVRNKRLKKNRLKECLKVKNKKNKNVRS